MNPADDLTQGFRLGDWEVRPLEGVLVGLRGPRHLQPKTVDVLLCLARGAGEVVQREQILHEVWGDRAVSDEPLTRCIGELRRELGDHREDPTYIQTIPKRGYQLVAALEPRMAPEPRDAGSTDAATETAPGFDWLAQVPLGAAALAAVMLIIVVAALMNRGAGTPGAPAAPRDNSIAVLPFADISSEGTNAWLGRGIAEDVLNLLVRFENLEVSARTSSFRTALQSLDIRDIGQKLHVHYVLEGSVRRDGERMKIAAQLIDAQTGYHVWSHVYDRTTSDLFAIQGEIAERVVKELQLAMPTQLPPGQVTPPTDNIDAYDYYLQARSMLERASNESSLDNAAQFFQRAIDFDPEFGEAFAGLCHSYVRKMQEHEAPNVLEPARVACARALDFASESPRSHAAMGALHQVTGDRERALEEFQWVLDRYPGEVDAQLGTAEVYAELGEKDLADELFREAIEISPDYAPAFAIYGRFLFYNGRATDAIRIYRRVTELDPGNISAYGDLGGALLLSGQFDAAAAAYRNAIARRPTARAYANVGTTYYYLGRFADAEVMYREAIELNPQDPLVWGNLGDALKQIPDRQSDARDAYQQARDLTEQELGVNSDQPLMLAVLGHYCAQLNDQHCAADSLGQAMGPDSTDFYIHYFAALVGIHLGDQDQAATHMARAVELGFPPVLLNADPLLESLRGNEKLAALIPGRGQSTTINE